MVDRDSTRRSAPPMGGGSGAERGDAGMNSGMKQQASETASQVKEQAAQLKDQVAEKATNTLDERKDQATGGLSNVSQVVRQTSEELRSRDQAMVAGYVDQAAEQLDRATRYLRSRDVRQIVGDVESFARREPTLFIGGAFALGLLAARFLKSSSQAIDSGDWRGAGYEGRPSYGTQAALSSYSSYSAMSQTRPMTVRPGDVSRSTAGLGVGPSGVPPASAGSFPTPTTGASAPATPATGGVSGVGTGGRVDQTRPGGTTSSRTGAPTARPLDTEPRANSGTDPLRERRGDDYSPSTRSGGDAGA